MLTEVTNLTPEKIQTRTERALEEAELLVAGILEAPPSFEATLAPFDRIQNLLTITFAETAFMGYVHPEPAVRAAGKEAEQRISEWAVGMMFRDELFQTVSAFSETPEAKTLQGERARLLEFVMRDFRKAGHELSKDQRTRLEELTGRLVQLGILFERNIAEHDDYLEVRSADLDGLPPEYVESLDSDEEGVYRITMAYPHVVPFLENSSRRDLRRELSRRFNSRAKDANRPLLEEAVAIRSEIAAIFGVPSWAHHKLDEAMAGTPEAVEELYKGLRDPLTKAAQAELDRMAALLERDTGETTLQSYDWRYYDTQLRRSEYGVDPSEVAAYLSLDTVLEGMLNLTAEVFGLRYERVDIPVWHPDVMTYGIHDASTGELISHFFMDLFPREGKFSHAAAFTLIPGRRNSDGSYQTPVSAIVANLTKPTASRPSLLQHSEVETLFHEFGHILHQTLTKAELVRFSGTNTEGDFVEAPSQIMEHWVWKADVLSRFAKHHQTREPIPDELVDQLVAARNLNIAISKLRQMSFGMLDMALHGPGPDRDLDRILAETTAISLFEVQEGTFFPASFGHLFGYDAGYYGYLWSEVYGDDMFSRFEAEGYTSPEVGIAYRREILERGGSRTGFELLESFLGREPNNASFLRKLGLPA